MPARFEWLSELLGRCYGAALVLYPPEFRNEFGEEMLQFFRDDCRRTARNGGWLGLVWLWLRAVLDLARVAPGVHMEILRQDVRFAWRMLGKSKAFSLMAIGALALGIGATSTIFSVVNAVLLRPLPFPEPDQLVTIWDKNPRGFERNAVSPPNFADYRARAKSFRGITAYYDAGANLMGPDGPEHMLSYVVSPEFFQVFGVAPLLGPGLDGPRGVVLSHRLWAGRFGADPAIVGKSLRIDSEEYTVRGVMPADFAFPSSETALWTSMPFDPVRMGRQARFLEVVGRLRGGSSVHEARAELDVAAAALAREYPVSNKGWGVTILPLREQMVGEVRTSLLVFLGAVAFVLLIACANVANLLLARSSGRAGEMAIRAAIGASATRLARQMLTESVLLALLGGAAGLALAAAGIAGLRALHPANLPRLDEVGIGGRVLLFTLAVSWVTGLICGLAPWWQTSRTDVNAGLKEGGKYRKGFGGDRLRGLLITAEIAVSLLLMLGAGLLIRTFLHLQRVERGFEARGAVSVTVDMPRVRYGDAQRRSTLIQEATARVRGMPGVTAAGMISNLPLTGGEGYNRFGFTVDGEPPSPEDHRFYARWVTPGYLRAMGIPLLRGRDFSDTDREGAAPVVIIDATLARRYFPNENPVGKFVRLSYAQTTPRQIIGVAGAVRLVSLELEPAPQIYVPVLAESRNPTMTLVVRSGLPLATIVERARGELHRIDGTLPVYGAQPLEELVADSIAVRRFRTLLMGLLAALALALAAVGIYGVVACMVGERRREIGVRMALGARRRTILVLILRQGMTYATVGVATGVAGAVVLTRALTSLLFGVSRLDAWSFAWAAVTVLGAACLACLVPAFQAARVDPSRVLRS